MTHRDEWLAIQARVEAQERELDEAKAENELLRAAHAQKVREAEQLKRELAAVRGLDGPPGSGGAGGAGGTERDIGAPRRAFGALAGMVAGSAMLGAAMITLGAPPPHRARVATTPMVSQHAGTVTAGAGLFDEGAACTVRVESVDLRPFDCRVEVSCEGHTLYGATANTGYVRCHGGATIRDTGFGAQDGDPRLELDLRRGRVVVEEQLGLGTQRVAIELATPAALVSPASPACDR